MNTNLWANPQIANAYQTDPRLGYAQALMQQGGSTAPVRSPLEGLARALQGGLGGWQAGNVKKGYQEQDESYRKGLAEALKGGDVLAALQGSSDPQLQQMGLEAKMRQAMTPGEKDPPVKVYDPETKTMRYVRQSQVDGMQAEGPQTPKIGDMRKYRIGQQDITDQWDGEKWARLGAGAAFAPTQNGSTEMGLAPFYTKDANGKTHAWQLSKAGGMVEVKIPKGQEVAPQSQFLNTGTDFVPMDKHTGLPVSGSSPLPIDVKAKEAQAQAGQLQGQAQFDLPTAENNATMALKEIQALRDDPTRTLATGMTSIVNAIPGTKAYDYQKRVNQARAGAFLQAFNSLRGGGAISDAEGRKAEDALARLDTAQSEEGFMQALNDFESVIQNGLKVAQTKAGQPAAGPAQPPAPKVYNYDSQGNLIP